MVYSYIFLSTGLIALGILVGWFTGQSGFSDEVLASFLPAILAIIGPGVIVWSLSDRNKNKVIAVGILLFLFSSSIYMGANIGFNMQQRRQYDFTHNRNLRGLYLHSLYLKECSSQQKSINDYRKEYLNLGPISLEKICP